MARHEMAFWDKVSSPSSGKLSASARQILLITRPYLRPSSRLLDVGCGSGLLSRHLAAYAGEVLAIDPSRGMIEAALASHHAQEVPNLSFRQAYLNAELGSPATYDVLTAFNVLHYLEEVEPFLQEAFRLLKPGGYFITATAFLGEKRSLRRAFMIMLTRLGIIPRMHFLRVEEVATQLTNVGFTQIEQQALSSLPEYLLVYQKTQEGL
ncbi:MAG: class I SAM-dependent methyltransferase [Bacteroidota bacterium]